MNFPNPPPPTPPASELQSSSPSQPSSSPAATSLTFEQSRNLRPLPGHPQLQQPPTLLPQQESSANRQHHAQLSHLAQSEAAQRAAAEAQAVATTRAIQAQHQHIQLQNLLALQSGQPVVMNGMNGAGAGPAMAVGPTPAGHQAELNIIYSLVEELSRQLTENRRQTEEIVNGIGRIRSRARDHSLGNDEVLGEGEIDAPDSNVETLISVLTESLERAKSSRDANFSLVASYARVLSALLGQFHAYKQKHVADVSAWHRSYRSQLAEARAENSRLREQIWEMQEHAGAANQMLREFRKKYDEEEARDARRIDDKAKRQEIRFWRRLAMPEIGEDDEVWSDDDDLIDAAEKERLREVERKVAEQAMAGIGSGDSQQGEDSEGEDGQGHAGMGLLGGVAMERDGSLPMPPSRPASTGSTGGQAG